MDVFLREDDIKLNAKQPKSPSDEYTDEVVVLQRHVISGPDTILPSTKLQKLPAVLQTQARPTQSLRKEIKGVFCGTVDPLINLKAS